MSNGRYTMCYQGINICSNIHVKKTCHKLGILSKIDFYTLFLGCQSLLENIQSGKGLHFWDIHRSKFSETFHCAMHLHFNFFLYQNVRTVSISFRYQGDWSLKMIPVIVLSDFGVYWGSKFFTHPGSKKSCKVWVLKTSNIIMFIDKSVYFLIVSSILFNCLINLVWSLNALIYKNWNKQKTIFSRCSCRYSLQATPPKKMFYVKSGWNLNLFSTVTKYFLVILLSISRCLFVAHSYLLAKKWREAVSLYNRVLSHATSAVTHFQEINSHTQVCFHITVASFQCFAASMWCHFVYCCTLGNK